MPVPETLAPSTSPSPAKVPPVIATVALASAGSSGSNTVADGDSVTVWPVVKLTLDATPVRAVQLEFAAEAHEGDRAADHAAARELHHAARDGCPERGAAGQDKFGATGDDRAAGAAAANNHLRAGEHGGAARLAAGL